MMPQTRSELAAAWEWFARQDDGEFPNDVPDAELLAQYRAAQRQAANRRHIWRWFAVLSSIAIVGALLATCGALPAGAHDLAAWSDPARDQWYRSLKVPGQSTSCCDLTDAAQMNPDKVKQDSGGAWWVDLGAGFVPVPPERVVRSPVSIDGLPYIFLMVRIPGSALGIRCFIPPVGTY